MVLRARASGLKISLKISQIIGPNGQFANFLNEPDVGIRPRVGPRLAMASTEIESPDEIAPSPPRPLQETNSAGRAGFLSPEPKKGFLGKLKKK